MNKLDISNESLNVLLNIRMNCRPKIFVCIGTPDHVWDSFGPMVGSLLKELNIPCIGCMDSPINAFNADSVTDEIKEKFSDFEIIAVDAAVTNNPDKANKIWIRDKGLKPGEAYSRNLKLVGNYSILYSITNDEKDKKDYKKSFNAALKTVQIIKKILE